MIKKGSTDAHAMLFCFVIVMTLACLGPGKARAIEIGLSPANNHHVAGINSGQPYVGGFQVLSDDFRAYGTIDGTEVTVAFLSTNPAAFPPKSWLGAGMFLQAQDHKYLFIDYGFYVMVVLDSDSNIFVDIGLYQTMEGSLPVHQPDARLVYTYTWKLTDSDPAMPIKLTAEWDAEGFLHYYVNAAGNEFLLTSIKPQAFTDCENMIPHFYGGNVIGEQFPLGRYVDFFQFGITGSEAIANNQWKVLLKDPMFLKQRKWISVENAWSIQGDISYLDQDARWGGRRYDGVNGQYPMSSQSSPHEVIFFYSGQTLSPGIVLWDAISRNSNIAAESSPDRHLTYVAQLVGCLSFVAIASFIGLRRARNTRK